MKTSHLLMVLIVSAVTFLPVPLLRAGPLDNWHQRYLPFPPSCAFQVAFGNGAFVAMGRGKIFTSSDGETWFQYLSPFLFSDPEQLVFLNGVFLSTQPMMTSSDGVVWTNHTGLSPRKLSFGNEVFVGIATGAILVSSNGVDWSTSVSEPTLDLSAIIFGNGLFIAVGVQNDSGIILSSPDGRGWAYRSHENANQSRPLAVAFGNGRFLARGYFGYDTNGVRKYFLSSDTGISWSPVAPSPSLQFRSDGSDLLVFQHGLFLAAGQNITNSGSTTHILSSADGLAWTEHDLGANFNVQNLALGAGTLVAAGDCGFVLQSDYLTNSPPALAPSLAIRNYPGLTFTGTIGKTYSIEYTTDIKATNSWQTLTNLLLLSSPSVWVDLEATNPARRFYRAVAK